MPKLLLSQNQFNAGELSPRLYGRSDLSIYGNGLTTATNCIIYPHGPVRRRNGSQYIAEVKDSSKPVKLIKFQFSSSDSFILEFGNLYIRFYTDSGQVQEADKTITGITQANPGVVTSASHGFVNGDHVVITEVVGMTELNGRRFTVANQAANTFELSGEDTTSHTAYASAGVANRIYTIVSPYDETEVDDLSFVQLGSTMYLAHPDFEPRILTRTATADWSITTLNAVPEPTVELGEFPATTLTPGAATGLGVTFTAGSSVFKSGDVGRQLINAVGTGRAAITAQSGTTATCDIVEDFPNTDAIASGDWSIDLSPIDIITPNGSVLGTIITLTATTLDVWRNSDVGRYVKIHNGVVQITKSTSATVAEGEVIKSLDSVSATAVWTLEDPAWNAARGFPRAVGLFEQRLILGGTVAQPQNIWMSEVGLFNSFGVGSNDADAIDITVVSNEVNQISWINGNKDLIVGTSGSEITINSGSGSSITPSTIRQQPRTYHGSNPQNTLNVGSEVLFVQQTNRKIRSLRFDFGTDTYTGDDLLHFAEHLTEDNIVETVYAAEPDSNIYSILDNGDMIVGTYERAQQVLGWTRYTTSGSFENVQSITSGSVDQVWIVVNRTVNSSTVRYIELFDTGEGLDNLNGFSDSFLTFSEPKVITGATKANPVVITATSHGFANDDTIKIIDVVGMTELNNRTFVVKNKTANTFELENEDGTAHTTYVSGGEAHDTLTTISGLDHLEGEVVQLKVDGATHPNKTVVGGNVTLDVAGIEVVAGLSYTTTITTLDREYDTGQGSMQGQRSRHVRPILKLYRSAKPLMDGEFLPSRSSVNNMDEKVPLFSGTVQYANLNWDDKLALTITLSDPLPLTLVGIFGIIEGAV